MSAPYERTSTISLFSISASLLFLIAVSEVQALPLATLIGTNGSIVQGDKLFDNFRTDPLNNAVVGNASPLDVGNIDIQGITTSGENGLRFAGPFSAIRTDGQAFGRYTIQYDVTVLDHGFLLSDIRHSFLFSQSGFGSGAVTTRAGTEPSAGPFAQLSSEVLSSSLIDESANLRDALAGIDVAVPSIAIFQVFQVSSDPGFDVPGSAQIGFVDVTFSQISAVPEPSTLALLGIGALGIIGYGRRR